MLGERHSQHMVTCVDGDAKLERTLGRGTPSACSAAGRRGSRAQHRTVYARTIHEYVKLPPHATIAAIDTATTAAPVIQTSKRTFSLT